MRSKSMFVGRTLLIFGLMLAAFGVIFLLAERYPWFKFGKLPGDLRLERGNTKVYIPFMSMLVLSALISAGFYLLRLFKR
jgi:hypothetical protein